MATTVLFDCDGTILDSMPAWHALETRLANKAGIRLTKEQTDALNRNTLKETIEYFYSHYSMGVSFSELYQESYAFLLNYYRSSVQAKRGIIPLLSKLKPHGIKTVIASSSPSELITAGLQHTGLASYFDACFSAADLNKSKQNTDFYRHIAASLQTNPCKMILIDDSAYALVVARIAGFKTIGIYDSDRSSTFSELQSCADHTITNLCQLDSKWLTN